MLKSLKGLLGLAAREDATAEELVPNLPAAEAELIAAEAAMADVEQAFGASLLQPEEAKSQQLDAARGAARVRVQRAQALVTTLRERLAEAREREAEAARVERYEVARRQADEAREALLIHYPELANNIVTLLGVVAEAEIAVREANEDLPAGAEPLARVEGSVRDDGGQPARIVSEITVERWCLQGDLDPERVIQADVREGPGGSHYVSLMGRARMVVLRRFREIRHSLPTPRDPAECLALKINLPGLAGRDPAIWKPTVPLHGRADPHDVVARAKVRRQPQPPLILPVETKYEPIGFYDLAAELERPVSLPERLSHSV